MQSSSSIRHQSFALGEIVSGYSAWINDPHRAASPEIKFGDWWRMEQTYWRMAWIEATDELYAEEMGRADRFLLLGRLDRKEVQALMRNWYDGDNLQAFLQRLEAARTPKPKADDKPASV